MYNLISASFFSCSRDGVAPNQDTALPPIKVDDGYLLAIADGVGGYKGGREASQIVIEYLRSEFSNEYQNSLINLFYNLRKSVEPLSETDKEYVNAASTLTLAYVTSEFVNIAHIGDCRLYAKRGLKLIQITKDHTQHQSYIDEGIFTARQLKHAKGKNVLTTAISRTLELNFDIIKTPLNELVDEDGSLTLFIMSDGAHAFWEKRPKFSLNTLSEPSRFVSSLKKRIENGPPSDDYSVVCARFTF